MHVAFLVFFKPCFESWPQPVTVSLRTWVHYLGICSFLSSQLTLHNHTFHIYLQEEDLKSMSRKMVSNVLSDLLTQPVLYQCSLFTSCLSNILHDLNPLSTSTTKWSNTLKQFVGKLRTNCLSVFDHFVGLALKELRFVRGS